MNKRRLTFRRYFKNYKSDEMIATIRLDRTDENEIDNVVITEQEDEWVDYDTGRIIVRPKISGHFLVGEITNRLYEYEQLGYSPEELKEIIDDRKKLKERLNSLYGASAFDGNVESLYPRLFVARGQGKTLMQAEFFKALVNNRVDTLKNNLAIKDVIFNDPATIIFWKDGTKTVVKADNEEFDPEKGLAMAISKKALGNQHEYYDVFKKWLKKFKPYNRTMVIKVDHSAKWLAEQRLHNALHDKKATKADLLAAMQDAITYLNNEKEN